ncbi:hypothetical protein Tco_0155749 [Tanacetum coccineum]
MTRTRFELKGQFLKELQDNTFSGSDNEDAKLKRQDVNAARDLTTLKMSIKRRGKGFEEAFYKTLWLYHSLQEEDFKSSCYGIIPIEIMKSSYQECKEIMEESNEQVLQERGSGSLPGLTKTNPRDYVKSISTTIETDTASIRRIRGARYAVLDNHYRMQTLKPNQLTIPFPSRLTDDCYDEMNVLDSATYGIF